MVNTPRHVIFYIMYSIVGIMWSEAEIGYTYNNEDNWGQNFNECRGRRQSPISVVTRKAKNNVEYKTPLHIVGLNQTPSSMKLENNGHHVILHLDYPEDVNVTYTGGPLGTNVYKANSAVYHWSSSGDGSEHEIDGQATPMEVQYMFYNTKYDSYNAAMDKDDGLIGVTKLIGVMDTSAIDSDISDSFRKLISYLPKIIEPGQVTDVNPPFPLYSFATTEDLSRKTFQYFMYQGSLTEPPCHQSVTWFINNLQTHITSEMVNEFRKLKLKGNDTRNDRSVQPLHCRHITFVIPEE